MRPLHFRDICLSYSAKPMKQASHAEHVVADHVVSHNPFAYICVCYLAQSSRVLGLSVGLPSVRKHTACRLGLVLFSSGFLPLCPVLSVFNLWLMNVLSTRCEAASLWNVLHSEDCMLNHVRPRGQDLVQNTWMTFSYHFKPIDPTHTHMHR